MRPARLSQSVLIFSELVTDARMGDIGCAMREPGVGR
jgi:hypothetical protein